MDSAGTRRRLIAASIVVFVGAAVYLAPRGSASQPKATPVSYWVGVSGNDSNPGTQALPFRTIQRGVNVAADQNVLGHSAVVNVNPGVYRETVEFPVRSYTPQPISLVSSTVGGAIIDGSERFTGWFPYSESIY